MKAWEWIEVGLRAVCLGDGVGYSDFGICRLGKY